jgi:hypothetical protein
MTYAALVTSTGPAGGSACPAQSSGSSSESLGTDSGNLDSSESVVIRQTGRASSSM